MFSKCCCLLYMFHMEEYEVDLWGEVVTLLLTSTTLQKMSNHALLFASNYHWVWTAASHLGFRPSLVYWLSKPLRLQYDEQSGLCESPGKGLEDNDLKHGSNGKWKCCRASLAPQH